MRKRKSPKLSLSLKLPSLSSVSEISDTMSNGRVWRKVLYCDNQGHQDNYTPPGGFLAAIESNR